MAWEAHLELHYRRDGDRTLADDRHRGPLRVLRRLYPEGPAVCHHVLVHPPGGLAGGDALAIDARLDAGTHALLTTPGATRFYRSRGEVASQSAQFRLGEGARLEWLPLETIAYPQCRAVNRLHFELADAAQMIGSDLLALGLPASGAPFEHGRFEQQIEAPGLWLERGVIDGADRLLLDSPLGLGGHRVLGTLWIASAAALPGAVREACLEAARRCIAEAAGPAGVSAPDPRLVVLRALATRVEPAQALLRAVWARWREQLWGLPACAPRVWST